MARLAGRFVWLLETMCRRQEIDIQLIDYELTYWENKANIEGQVHKRLILGKDWQGKKAGRVEEFDEDEVLVGDEWCDEFEREMIRQQERKEAIDQILEGEGYGGKT